MKENNEIIAEFMGGKWQCIWIFDGNNGLPQNTTNLMFDRSWDWLMPVVEKIENDLLGQVDIHTAYTNINGEFPLKYNQDTCFESQDDTKLTVTYRAIIRFLEWYNTTQQEQKHKA